MTNDSTPAGKAGTNSSRRQEDAIQSAMALGMLLAVVGLSDGLVMAFRSGHAGNGIAIAVFSVLLEVLVVFSGMSATAVVRARGAANPPA